MKYSRIVLAISACMLMSFLHLKQKNPLQDDLGLFLPDYLEVSLWAESPLFFNPTNMDVDAKGRIWVTEAVNYRNFNNDSTKLLHHTKGDRVIILEDTDHDGKADQSTVFTEDRDLVSPLGIAVIGNKVIVSCAPNLIVYTDDDGDDFLSFYCVDGEGETCLVKLATLNSQNGRKQVYVFCDNKILLYNAYVLD